MNLMCNPLSYWNDFFIFLFFYEVYFIAQPLIIIIVIVIKWKLTNFTPHSQRMSTDFAFDDFRSNFTYISNLLCVFFIGILK